MDTNLAENKPGAVPTSIRERLAKHRTNPGCASCHSVIDPLGFALENFDVIGGWRTVDESGKPVDASGTTLSGAKVEGLSGLRALLLERGLPAGEFERVEAAIHSVVEDAVAFAIESSAPPEIGLLDHVYSSAGNF